MFITPEKMVIQYRTFIKGIFINLEKEIYKSEKEISKKDPKNLLRHDKTEVLG